MKGIFGCVVMFIFAGALTVSAQQKSKKQKTLAEIFTPPNGVHLKDSLFIDETEIVNIHYLEYLHYVQKDSSLSFYLSQLPDTTVWQQDFTPRDSVSKYQDHYFRFPGYRYYPVVGVSYEQALNYCRWRAKAILQLIAQDSLHKRYPNLAEYNLQLSYRLPTEEEWELAAAGALDKTGYPYGIIRPTTKRKYAFPVGKNKDVCKCLDFNNIAYQRSDVIHALEFKVLGHYYFNVTTPPIICPMNTAFNLGRIYDLVPNTRGLYHMIGNVAEMTSTRGVAKGGSFRHTLAESTIQSRQHYQLPTAWLGFRCIAIVQLTGKK